MINWLNQQIQAGDYVYRGARDGNSSSFRIGQVESVNIPKRTAKVNWLYEDGYYWSPDRVYFTVPGPPYAQQGSCNVNTLMVIDKGVVDGVQSLLEEVARARELELVADDFERVTGITRGKF